MPGSVGLPGHSRAGPWESLGRNEQGSEGSTTPPHATSCNPCGEVHAPTPAPCPKGDGLGLILALCMAKEGWSGLLEPQGWPCLGNQNFIKICLCAEIHNSDSMDAMERPCPELD